MSEFFHAQMEEVAVVKTLPIAIVVAALLLLRPTKANDAIVLGSKKFTESFVLAEIAKRSLAASWISRRASPGHGRDNHSLGSVKQGSIAAYPDYTGTIQQEILKTSVPTSIAEMRA